MRVSPSSFCKADVGNYNNLNNCNLNPKNYNFSYFENEKVTGVEPSTPFSDNFYYTCPVFDHRQATNQQ